MRKLTRLLTASLICCTACHVEVKKDDANAIPISGTWRLFKAWSIQGKDTTVTDYTKDRAQIKIINDNHFAFLGHDQHPPADSSNHFDGGGGAYDLKGDQYTEHLDYYSDRHWEGKTFTFTVSVANDTLTQQGLEKVEGTNVDHIIIEKYTRVK